MALRYREHPNHRVPNGGFSDWPLRVSPTNWVWTIQDQHRDVGRGSSLGCAQCRGYVRIRSTSDILKIDEQQVDERVHLRCRSTSLPVQTEDSDPRHRLRGIRNPLLIQQALVPMLRAEDRGNLDAGVEESGEIGDPVGVNTSLIGEQPYTPITNEMHRVAEQHIDTWTDQLPVARGWRAACQGQHRRNREWPSPHLALLWLGLVFVIACARPPADAPVPIVIPDPVNPTAPDVPAKAVRADKIHVDSLLETLSTREKVGQLLMPWLLGDYAPFASEQFDTLNVWVDSLEVGGIVISVGPPFEVAAKLNELQRRSTLPLVVAADLEWGLAMRVRGSTAFPMPMGIGATGRTADAYEMGRITAIEARATGIHWTFAPVADVNNNPDNPIINTRSFGEDPQTAAELVAAFIRGASEHGLYTTAKHFPGHGDTESDSHITLPVVAGCWDRLDAVELVPFRAAIREGVTAVMTAHVALPCLDGDIGVPATLSPQIMTGVLRDSLAFDGLVITDALDMGALVAEYGAGETTVRAFLAGADMLLMPSHLTDARDAMARAVATGRISMSRLDASVRRVLDLKERAGLFEARTVPLEQIPEVVANRDFADFADQVAARSLTLVQRGPLDQFRDLRGRVSMVVYANETNLSAGSSLARELRLLGDTVQVFRLYPASGTLSYDSARTVLSSGDRALFAVNVRVVSGLGHVAMPDSLVTLIQMAHANQPTVLASLGNPYLLRQLPDYSGGYLIAWADLRSTERAVARALSGGAAITGTLPITVGERYARGFGISVAAVDRAESNGRAGPSDPSRFDSLRTYLEAQVETGAFPGGVLFVGHEGRIVFRTAFGRYGVNDARPVTDSTVYDLASLTKVIGLTTACMILVADGRLDLDQPVAAYLPTFAAGGKDAVTVRQLLLHTSGLPPWRPLYQETETANAAIDSVMATALDTLPGARYAYSDLGAITLGKVVEAVAGVTLDRFLRERLFDLLGMSRTRFRPPSSWREMIAPTEFDPWRGRTILGEVHDENAARLGGVSGHAGLFSNGPDLMRFGFWLADAYHDRLSAQAPVYLPSRIVREFTSRRDDPHGSTRALGWDTPSDEGRSSAGRLMSRRSYGHTGFTGTSIWTDPERDLIVVLLTNRVHPTRDNLAISRIRGEVADLVVEALERQ